MRAWFGYAATGTVTALAVGGAIVWHYGEALSDALRPEPKPIVALAETDPVTTGSTPPRAATEQPGKPRRFPQSAFSPGEIAVPTPTVKTTILNFGDAEPPPAGRFGSRPPSVRVARAPGPQSDVAVDAPSEATARKPRLPTRTLVGPQVVDARTLSSAEGRIRLAGIALPAADSKCRRLDGVAEPCRDRAKTQLELFLRHRPVVCSGEPDAAACRIGKGDVAEWLVRSGWMLAEAQADPRLQRAAAEAKRRKLGIWR